MDMTYTAVTFAPVQSFIRASRKLRDLYGSSLLLSHLARALADDASARGLTVISPASVQSSRGVPNVLVIEGDYRKGYASDVLLKSWRRVLDVCRQWLEEELADTTFDWHSSWKACGSHSWELFHGQGTSIQLARQALAVSKLQRDWTISNWTGESSTLSSADAVVWPGMAAVRDPRDVSPGLIKDQARRFLGDLRIHPKLGIAFAGEREEISIPELVKRLVTYPAVIAKVFATDADPSPDPVTLIPERFQNLSMIAKENQGDAINKSESIVWFMADGDGVGAHLQELSQKDGERQALQQFSRTMREWAAGLYSSVPDAMASQALVVYAGGDDLFGALHESEPGANDLTTSQLWDWLEQFPQIWEQCDQPNLTVSMGLVWADAKVPQREALQHVREAEASAKARGKNRFALRLLYANGNHLEWTCPWQWLPLILSHYRDREGRQRDEAKWRHIADDLQWLYSRQSIAAAQSSSHAGSAEALWGAYFPGLILPPLLPRATSHPGSPPPYTACIQKPEAGARRFDQWLLDLGRVMAGLEKHRSNTTRRSQR